MVNAEDADDPAAPPATEAAASAEPASGAQQAVRGIGLRKTDRAEGLRLLYGAALDTARQRGLLKEDVLFSQENSGIEGQDFVIRDERGNKVAAINLDQARKVLAYRRRVARRVFDRLDVTIKADSPVGPQKNKVRVLMPEVRALVWAISTGRRIPVPPERPQEALKTAGLLLCCLLPGILYILEGMRERRRYNDELADLLKRWRKQGMPDPEDSFFAHYHL